MDVFCCFFRGMVPCVRGMRRRVGRGSVSSWRRPRPSMSRHPPSCRLPLSAFSRCPARLSPMSQIASHRSLTTARPSGNRPRLRPTFPSRWFNDSMPLVVQTTRRGMGGNRRNGANRSHARSHAAATDGYLRPSSPCLNPSSRLRGPVRVRRPVHVPQPGAHLLAVRVGHEPVRRADEIHHAGLHHRLRPCGPDGPGQALQPVAAHDRHVHDAPVGHPVAHARPERGSLRIPYPDARHAPEPRPCRRRWRCARPPGRPCRRPRPSLVSRPGT